MLSVNFVLVVVSAARCNVCAHAKNQKKYNNNNKRTIWNNKQKYASEWKERRDFVRWKKDKISKIPAVEYRIIRMNARGSSRFLIEFYCCLQLNQEPKQTLHKFAAQQKKTRSTAEKEMRKFYVNIYVSECFVLLVVFLHYFFYSSFSYTTHSHFGHQYLLCKLFE